MYLFPGELYDENRQCELLIGKVGIFQKFTTPWVNLIGIMWGKFYTLLYTLALALH